jgi:3-hydroxyisobutyrate dehydrogenase-like beta-hydroxyacid dehydrogenase
MGKKTDRQKVSIIGLGAMGSSLAAAFVRNDFDVTVWNRDPGKAATLVRQGAKQAMDAGAAIGASDVTIVCVSNYNATNSILQLDPHSLQEKLIVQLSSGTPNDARDLANWTKSHGGKYLDGAILAWPSQIGGVDTTILISGPERLVKQSDPVLRTLAGNLRYMGEEIGSSEALFAAVLSYLAGSWVGFCHGALVSEKEGLRVDEFGVLLQQLSGILGEELKNMGEVIHHKRYANPESTIQTTGADLLSLVRHAEEADISKELPQFAAELFQRAIRSGYGAEEHAAVFKVLQSARASK